MDVALPTKDSDTLGGFIYTQLGKVPARGEQLSFGDLDLTVESVVGRRIKKVRVVRRLPLAIPDQVAEALASDDNGSSNGKRRWMP